MVTMFSGPYHIGDRPIGQDFWAEHGGPMLYRGDCPVQPLQYKWEFERFLQLAEKERPWVNVLEIGSEKGGTIWEWKKRMWPGGTLVSISSDCRPEWERDWHSWFDHKNINLKVFREDSHQAWLREAILQMFTTSTPFDMVFIDGDHTYLGAKMDFEMYGSLVKPGGMVVLHDIIFTTRHVECRVDQLWDEIKASGYQTRELYASRAQSGLGIGVVYIDKD